MKERYGRSSALMAALVFVVFGICVLLVLLLGAGVYRHLLEAGESRYSDWVPAQYLATRLRQAGDVRVEDFGSCQALSLEETVEGECYVTRVYLYDGYLRELYSEANAALHPEDGEKLLPAWSLALRREGNCLWISINGQELAFHIRTEGEALP